MATPAHIWCHCCHPVAVFMGQKTMAGLSSDDQVKNAGRLLNMSRSCCVLSCLYPKYEAYLILDLAPNKICLVASLNLTN